MSLQAKRSGPQRCQQWGLRLSRARGPRYARRNDRLAFSQHYLLEDRQSS